MTVRQVKPEEVNPHHKGPWCIETDGLIFDTYATAEEANAAAAKLEPELARDEDVGDGRSVGRQHRGEVQPRARRGQATGA